MGNSFHEFKYANEADLNFITLRIYQSKSNNCVDSLIPKANSDGLFFLLNPKAHTSICSANTNLPRLVTLHLWVLLQLDCITPEK